MTSCLEAMSAVVAALAPVLKDAGFKKRRYSFNRSADDGLVHVFDFQMGPSDPPGATHIPGLTDNLHGKFTVNLGVYSPDMTRLGAPAASRVNEIQLPTAEATR
jgi:hypothetical protein